MVYQRPPLAFIIFASFAATALSAPSSEPLDSGIVLEGTQHVRRAITWNDHHEEYGLHDDANFAARAIRPDLKPELDAAMSQNANLKHFFWTGWTLPGSWKTTSVMKQAERIAKIEGGTTLEATIDHIQMPTYKQRDKNSTDTWDYASSEFARLTKGDAYLIQGDQTRPKNVWIEFEFDRLKKNPNVPRVWRINLHAGGKQDPKYQIWPECADLEDKKLSCPSDAKLYHGAPGKPKITSKTTIAKDGRAGVQPASASTILRECHQLIDGKMVKELMQKAGSCPADKDINRRIKELLSSAKNRHYVQKARIYPLVKDLESDVINQMKFKKSPLDGLVAIDYYTRTLNDANNVAKQIDDMLKAATGESPGIATASAAKMKKISALKDILLVLVKKQIAAAVRQAAATEKRNAACNGSKLLAVPPRRMERRFSPIPFSSLEARVVKAPRSGAKAPAAPACPLKGAPAKKTVPRSMAATKAPPAKKPRVPSNAPARKPVNTQKKVAARPASRARRTPGKSASRKRTAPKRKPKVVPKPTRRPKGKPRSRKRNGRK